MSGSGKKILDVVEEILKEVLDLKKHVKDVEKLVNQNDNKSNIDSETLQHIHSIMTDISCKLDLGMPSLSSTSSKKPSSKSKTDDSKPKLNIMTYFKQKYKDDKESMDHIISKKEIEELYKKHADELNKKKKGNLLQFQLSLIYKELIKDDQEKVKALRKLKEEEEEKELDDAENNEAEDSEDNVVESEEDSD